MDASRRLMTLMVAGAIACAGMARTDQAVGEEIELSEDLVHSDLPLWGDGPNVWPQSFADGDAFGCASRVAFGGWQVRRPDGETSWWRISNYGAIHCALVVTQADERAELDHGAYGFSVAVKLKDISRGGKVIELWALQIGMRPGSDYILLSRIASERDTFTVLQRRCPAGRRRAGNSYDIWRTDYCAINSPGELVTLAEQMARLPPLAVASLQPDHPNRAKPTGKKDADD